MAGQFVDRLSAAVEPPEGHPNGEREWESVEKRLGWSLPADYKHLVDIYGRGKFAPPELFVWDFSVEIPDVDQIMAACENMEDSETFEPLPKFASSRAIFPWARDAVGSIYFWVREGAPDEWYVIVTKGRIDYYRFPEHSLSSFLVALLVDKDPRVVSLWSDMESRTVRFVPAKS